MDKTEPVKTFAIDGAVVWPEVQVIDETADDAKFKFPKINKDYKIGAIYEGLLFAAKQGETKAVLALAVEKDGKQITIHDFTEGNA